MPAPTIIYNNSTGSNTAASGAGPGDGNTAGSAVTGSAAAHTGGSASTTITLTNSPDLSGVLTTGVHSIRLFTASGRQWSKITAADNSAKTVTVEDSFTIASGSAVNYAIGAKLKDFETATATKQLFTDAKPGWIIDIQEAGSSYVLTSTITVAASGDTTTGRIIIQSSSANRPTITSATNSATLFSLSPASYITFKHLKLTSTAGTRGNGIGCTSGTSNAIAVTDCVISGTANGVTDGGFGFNNLRLTATEIANCTSNGIFCNTTAIFTFGCYIHGCTGSGYSTNSNGTIGTHYLTIFAGNSYGIQNTSTAAGGISGNVLGCTFYANTNDGIKVSDTANQSTVSLSNCIFWGQGGYGINFSQTTAKVDATMYLNYLNAYGGNNGGGTGLDRNNLSAGTGDISLSAIPFSNVASGDFSLNSTAGGGALVRGTGFPGSFPGGTTTGYSDIGAVQHLDSRVGNKTSVF